MAFYFNLSEYTNGKENGDRWAKQILYDMLKLMGVYDTTSVPYCINEKNG